MILIYSIEIVQLSTTSRLDWCNISNNIFVVADICYYCHMLQHSHCPCGFGGSYEKCCEPLLNGVSVAATAEALMSSRYTAYVLLNETYLLSSWHPSTRPQQLELLDEPVKWSGLTIISTESGQANDNEGTVEFLARYKINGKAYRLHEVSHFIKEGGCWFYVGGELTTPASE